MIPNGSTPIKNEILIEIFAKGRLTRMEMRIASYVMRWSWGFDGKKRRQDWTKSVMEKEIAENLGIHKVVICRTIRQMIQRKILLTEKLTKGLCYQFNEHYKDWKKLTETLTRKKLTEKLTKVNQKVNKIDKKLTEKLTSDTGNKELADDSETLKETLIKETLKEKTQTEPSNESKNQEAETDNLITLYKEKFPAHIKRFGLSAIMKMRDTIDSAVMEGAKLEDIAKRISTAKDGTPWKIISENWLNKYKKEKKNYDKLIKRFSN